MYLRVVPASDTHRIRQALSPTKVVLPLILGLGMAWWLLDSSWDHPVKDPATGNITTTRDLLHSFSWTVRASWAMAGALLCVLVRDLAYMVRIRILAMGTFTWRSAFSTILLWEFASALTPSVVGGSAVAVLILKREGMSVGRSVATVFLTALMDELFYVLAVPVAAVLVAFSDWGFFPEHAMEWPIESLFALGYGFIVLLTTLILFGVLVAPNRIAKGMNRLFTLPGLRRWKEQMKTWTADLVLASEAFKGSGWRLGAQAMLATVISWSARFLTLNFLLLVFFEAIPHAAVLGRQLVMWVILLISPTPGSSGFAEVALPQFLGDITGFAYLAIVAVIWRLFTYFPYLFAGAMVLPSWLERTRRRPLAER